MKALVRLLLVYFTGTLLARAISLAGALAIVVGGAALLRHGPHLTTQIGLPAGFSLVEEAILMVLPLAGTLALFFGSALLPLIFGRFATGRLIHVLPAGRGKLLASALVTTLLLSLVASATGLIYYHGYPIEPTTLFGRGFIVSFVTYSALYVALWVIGRMKSALALLTGAMLVLAALALPVSFEGMPDSTLVSIGLASAALWCGFGAAFLLAPRHRAWSSARRAQLRAFIQTGGTYAGGDELELAIGTNRPWVLALGQVLPLGGAALFLGDPRGWFLYFVLLSAIAGGIASTAATRSRALWLRAGWDRTELFARVERAYWRQSAYALGVLAMLLVALGLYQRLPTEVLAAGIVTLLLGMAACIYLGLMMTRGIGWRETLTAVGTMAFMMGAAVWVADADTSAATLALLETTLLVLAAVFRQVAKRRWSGLDWLLCRPETTARSSA